MEDKSILESSKSSFSKSSFNYNDINLLEEIHDISNIFRSHSAKDKSDHISSPKSPLYINLIKDKKLKSLSISKSQINQKKRDSIEIADMLDKFTLDLDENDYSTITDNKISSILKKLHNGKMLYSPNKKALTENSKKAYKNQILKPILTEEETFIRFNKIGWICIFCSNFNFEQRLYCNRCKYEKKTRKKYFDPQTRKYVETKKELSTIDKTVSKNTSDIKIKQTSKNLVAKPIQAGFYTCPLYSLPYIPYYSTNYQNINYYNYPSMNSIYQPIYNNIYYPPQTTYQYNCSLTNINLGTTFNKKK